MSHRYDGFSAGQRAFATSLEAVVEPDQVSIALALHERLQPVAARIEDVLLQANAAKQRADTLAPGDTPKQHFYVEQARGLAVVPEAVIADPHGYTSYATQFMHTMLGEPQLLADIFAGYTPVSPGVDWSRHFFDAGLTNRWETYILAALRLEEASAPRPSSVQELAQAALEYGLQEL